MIYKSRGTSFIRGALPFVIMLIAMALFLQAVSGVYERSQAESYDYAEESIRRAVVQCYAIEGRYPIDMDYLRDNYGVSVSEEKYMVHYEYVASNLMPDISVIALGG